MQRTFGISLAEYDAMLDEQDYRCAICRQHESAVRKDTGNEIRLSVDHDHACCPGSRSCGECVRGLLCFNCNSGIGQFKDDTFRLRSAIRYLSKD